MTDRIQRIVVVGGGTAGWMSAVFLNRALGAQVHITVVESKTIGTVGVGEATFNSLKKFFDFCGLPEQKWMPACNATYKFAIKYVDWNAARRSFYHPFEQYRKVSGVWLSEWWLRTRRDQPFDQSCFFVPDLCDTSRSPRFLDGTICDPNTENLYGYQFDAKLVADFLRTVAVRRGVEHVWDDVRKVNLGEGGEIASLTLAEGRSITADLFVDCTGFRGLLINQALGEPFDSFGDELLCDSAVATRMDLEDPAGEINPFTTATALAAGWVWDIPLYNRVGTGYVYSSRFRTKEEAEQELRDHLGPRADAIDVFHIKMRTGRTRNPWVKNCVSVGLSCGFVEPLESTGIFFIQYSLLQLLVAFPSKRFDEAVIRRYNQAVGDCIDDVRDFLVLHYFANDRRDSPFWNAVKDDIEVPARLQEKLELWKRRLPSDDNVYPEYHGFAHFSWAIMALGLDYEPETSYPLLDYLDGSGVDRAFAAIRQRSSELRAALPSHREYLDHLYDGSTGSPSP